jgi:hypothetical protein
MVQAFLSLEQWCVVSYDECRLEVNSSFLWPSVHCELLVVFLYRIHNKNMVNEKSVIIFSFENNKLLTLIIWHVKYGWMDGRFVSIMRLHQLERSFLSQWYERIILFGEIEKFAQDGVRVYFNVLSQHSPGGTEKNHWNYRDSNLSHPEHKSEALTLKPACTMRSIYEDTIT